MPTARRDSSDRRRRSPTRIAGRSTSGTTPASSDRLQLFYGSQYVRALEPTSQGNSIPGFGQRAQPSRKHADDRRDTHIFGSALLNEVRFGRTHLDGGTFPASPLNPADFGIRNGVTRAIGLPQMIVAGELNFGGPGTLPQGRYRHVVRRQRHASAAPADGTRSGSAASTGTSSTTTSPRAPARSTSRAWRRSSPERRTPSASRSASGGARSTSARVGAVRPGQIAVRDRLTLDLGLRYEWHVTPTERDNRFIVFDAATRVAGPRRRGRRRDLPAEQPELRAARRRRVELVVRRPHRAARRLRAGGGRAGHDGGQGHGGQSAVRDPVDGRRLDPARRRDRRRRGPSGWRRPRSIRASGTRRCDRGTSTCSGSSPAIWP